MPKRSRKELEELNDKDDKSDENEKPRFPKLLDGTYYVVVDYVKKTDSVDAKCVHCTKKETIISGNRKSTGNFHTHYVRVHPDIYEEVKDYCNVKEEKRQGRKSKVQSILPFANVLDPVKVSSFYTCTSILICINKFQ